MTVNKSLVLGIQIPHEVPIASCYNVCVSSAHSVIIRNKIVYIAAFFSKPEHGLVNADMLFG